MDFTQIVIYFIIFNSLIIVLFFKINHLKFSFKDILLALALRLLLAILLTSLNRILLYDVFSYLDEPLYGILLAFVFLKSLPKTLLVFYGLFPVTLWNLFYRSISYFIFPFLDHNLNIAQFGLITYLRDVFGLILVFLFLKWLQYDFIKIRTNFIDDADRRVLYLTNLDMVVYYLIMQLLIYLEYEHSIKTIAYRQLILVVYLIIFMGIMKQLDTHLREKLQQKLDFQKQLQLNEMGNYSNHIEELYREVRGFRHDYVNLLTTIRLGIEENDMRQIEEVYNSVLKDSYKRLRDSKYDVGRLINVKNSALKSLLSAKIMQATDKNLSVTLEVPESIEPKGMDLVDFITVVSILCDNAIDAAIPKVNIAFFNNGERQMFIVENSIKEESINISDLYSFGYSTKGSNRGVGLYNVMKILEHYPNVSLNTKSHCYKFCQVLEIGIK